MHLSFRNLKFTPTKILLSKSQKLYIYIFTNCLSIESFLHPKFVFSKLQLMHIVGGEELKRENHRIKPAQGVVLPNYMSGKARINLDKIVWEIEESGMPEELEGQVLLGGSKIDHQVHKAESQGGKERCASEEMRKFSDIVLITFAFNALHQLNWPY